MGTSYISKRRKTLIERDPHCHWCGKDVVEAQGQPKLHFHATIDHLYGKVEGRPVIGKDLPWGTKTLVLSCLGCNTERSKHQGIKLSKVAMWCKSGRFPQRLKYLEMPIKLLHRVGVL